MIPHTCITDGVLLFLLFWKDGYFYFVSRGGKCQIGLDAFERKINSYVQNQKLLSARAIANVCFSPSLIANMIQKWRLVTNHHHFPHAYSNTTY